MTSLAAALLLAVTTRADLVAHWSLNEPDGSTTVLDSASDFDMTAQNGVPALGAAGANADTGTASEFTNTHYWVTSANDVFQTNAFSVTFWFKVNTIATGYRTVLGSRYADKNGWMVYLNGTLQFWISNGGSGWNQLTAAVDTTDGPWYFVVCTWNDSADSQRLSVTQAGASWTPYSTRTTTNSIPMHANPANRRLALGARADGGAPLAADGNSIVVDDMRYYDHALTEEEAWRLYWNRFEVAPILHWRLDEPSGATTAIDARDRFDGTPTNATTFGETGVSGGAAGFTGRSARIYRPLEGGLILPYSYTVSLWFKDNNTSQNYNCLTETGNGNAGWRWYYDSRDANERFEPWHWNGATWSKPSYAPLGGNQWFHFAATYDAASSNHVLYVDGTEVNSATNDYVPGTIGSFTAGGRSNDDTYGVVDGSIDDVQLYPMALTAEQINWLYRNPGLSTDAPLGCIFTIR